MGEKVPSSAPLPATPHFPLPITSYKLKIERDCETTPKEETNPLDTDDSIVLEPAEVFDKLEPERDFILMFESLPVLWDPNHPYYTNKYKRHTALLRLVPILKRTKPDATTIDVKKKINSIRSNYRRELRKVLATQDPGDDDEVYEPKIWYFPYLDFLRKLEQRQNSSYQNKSVLPKSNSQKINEISQVGTSFQSVNKPMSIEQSSVRKRKFQGQLIEPQRQTSKLTTESCQPNTISNHIVLEWVDTLEKLDPMQRLFAKKAINDVLFEAELGNLQKHSVKINEPLSSYQLSSSPAHSSLKSPSSPSYQ
ncbi:uncharacterized protein LOC123654921 [Melitaea cinxia]|uniref:uncharacterized protein LOC123654921 n=1 Tax=Melitaea cinxia TaxID=113334 RepID=UPI001E272B12|nr:uncharacterized protein LOC123654921 [Melitaea cinxia]